METTDSCVDAETLAAWMDGGLTAPELARAQAHAAGCPRCQEMLGAMARISEPAPAVKAQAGLRAWLTWLAPFAAAAAAVIIWVKIPGSNLDTRVPAPPPPTASAPSTTEAKQQTVAPAPAPPASAQSAAAREVAPERGKEEARRETTPRAKALNDTAAVSPDALDKATQGAAAGPVTATGNAPLIAPQAGPVITPMTAEQASPAGGGGGASRAGVAGGVAGGRLLRQDSRSFADALATAEIRSPDPLIRWRLAGANVEHSIDGGASWELTRTGMSTLLTAGAAVSPTSVWIVGQSGVVLVSSDGRTWRRVSFPQSLNLSAVRARDARSVTVTAADGRIFSTTDAGASWITGPLQGF